MLSRIRSFFSRITGFSTPVGGLQWTSPSEALNVPRFEGTIAITGEENDKILDFLEHNVGSIVFLNCQIDACLATSKQHEIVDREKIDLDAIARGEISQKRFVLLNPSGNICWLELLLLPTHRVNASFGGTGVILLALQGFFEVNVTHHGGPSKVFYLTEQPASVEMRLRVHPNAR